MDKREASDEAAKPWQSYHTVYTCAKAGMDGVDKEKVQRIIYEMSKGSKYFENEERKEVFIRQKIEKMLVRCGKLSAATLNHYQKVVDKRIVALEATRDLSRIWLHVDMDAFYAAVETLMNPALKGKPMAVGSMSMISTANYEARRFGVRAAMPGFIARKLCPELIFVPVDFKKYTQYSSLTRKVFERYDPNFIATSLDEAYLDITEACKERDLNSNEIAEELRRSVFEETGLTCSAGVAPNRLLAKVCSDINKPNGQFVLPNDRMAVLAFISSLPVRKIGGIGKVTESILRDAFGISTCEEMLKKSALLCALFSPSSAEFFLSVGLGLGQTDTPEVRLRKSMSNERTFSATEDEAFLYTKLAELAETLSSDLQKEGLHGRTLTLKLKTASFEVRTRAVTLERYIDSSEDILKHASKLLKAELPVSLRLIGLRVSYFREEHTGPFDPTQKSITNFVVSGDTSSNNGINSCVRLNVMDHKLAIAQGSDTATRDDGSCKYVYDDRLDCDRLSDYDYSNCTSSGNVRDWDSSRHSDMTASNTAVHIAETNEGNIEQPFTTNSSPLTTKDVASSSNELKHIRWVDDYKCSACGIEVPPEFVEERQEHSDFHLAQRLQEECSRSNSNNHLLKQRHIEKDEAQSQSRHKKRKQLPERGKFLHIDNFFTKTNQNF